MHIEHPDIAGAIKNLKQQIDDEARQIARLAGLHARAVEEVNRIRAEFEKKEEEAKKIEETRRHLGGEQDRNRRELVKLEQELELARRSGRADNPSF